MPGVRVFSSFAAITHRLLEPWLRCDVHRHRGRRHREETAGTRPLHLSSRRRHIDLGRHVVRDDLGGVAKITWAVAAIIPLVPFIYVLTGNELSPARLKQPSLIPSVAEA